jgi:hypothetical protein
MYTTRNYKTKKALKEDIAAGTKMTIFAPGIGSPIQNGVCAVSGPHFPKPHTWYAEVTLKDGVIVKVK